LKKSPICAKADRRYNLWVLFFVSGESASVSEGGNLQALRHHPTQTQKLRTGKITPSANAELSF